MPYYKYECPDCLNTWICLASIAQRHDMRQCPECKRIVHGKIIIDSVPAMHLATPGSYTLKSRMEKFYQEPETKFIPDNGVDVKAGEPVGKEEKYYL